MPTWVLDATHILGPYYERVGSGPRDIQPLTFTMMVSWWLQAMTDAEGGAVSPPVLVRTGLPQAMAHGEVVRADA
ncbi:hypothetical protein D7X30_40805 [Corallococcus sp. AB011P]|uniref:hypothetical protein n=1 Tax=Corallococcus sp. AB011P TaxID=2316735 RepID=UPI000EA261D6|nr:hypothetical protein [Corallococcus sp. AB011P]RKG48325.1 hypothetical protein D7X30_40805 [Corallococcus sp. AB011P]